jgi:hypothetical protein
MKQKLFGLILIAALGGAVTGCVETVDGHSQAGVPFVRDTVEGRYERPVQRVLSAARAVIKFNGTIVADNSVNNSIEGRVDRDSVFIRVDELDPIKPVSRVIVQARTRGGGRDLDLAHEIEKEIGIQLATQR